MKTKKFYVFLATVLAVCLLLPVAGSTMTISPQIIELNAVKGDVISQSLKIHNESAAAEIYFLSTEKFVAAGEAGTPEFVSGGEDVDLVSWIKFSTESITVPAGATVEVPFTITVPSYASPGGHYAAIFLSTAPVKATPVGSSISITSRMGCLILIKIAGEVKESAELAEFSTSAKSFSSLPVDFAIRVSDTGNVHLKPVGTILIKNIFGLIVGKISVNDNKGNVLPGQIRKYDVQWVKNPNATDAKTFWGKYRDQSENYAFGRYTADLALTYGSAGWTLSGVTSFWVIPWNIILVNLLIVIMVVIILCFAVKKYNAWLLKKYGKKRKK